MNISTATKKLTVHADRPLDLAGSIGSRIRIPANALGCLLRVRKTANGNWGGPIAVEGEHGPLAVAASIDDPGETTLVASVSLGIDQLDGLDELVLPPLSSGTGIVRAHAVFTLTDLD